jgi:hypothetical protein
VIYVAIHLNKKYISCIRDMEKEDTCQTFHWRSLIGIYNAIYEFIIIIGEINHRRISFEKKRDLLHVYGIKNLFFLGLKKKKKIKTWDKIL